MPCNAAVTPATARCVDLEVNAMSVHIDEIHTDVLPAPPAGGPVKQEGTAERIGSAEDAWSESRHLLHLIARRTAAEGFDD
jgi:hypothetical protein